MFSQIAYRTASNKFVGKLAQLFLVLSDSHKASNEASDQPPLGRGLKHRLDDDQMSVESVESKRPGLASSAEKGKNKPNPKSSQSKPGKGNGSQNKPKSK